MKTIVFQNSRVVSDNFKGQDIIEAITKCVSHHPEDDLLIYEYGIPIDGFVKHVEGTVIVCLRNCNRICLLLL